MRLVKCKTKEEWLNQRQSLITGTELSCILDLNPWKTLKQLRAEKKDGDKFEGNAKTQVGQILEPAIILAANKVLNKQFESFTTKEFPFIICIDDEILLGASPDAITDNGLNQLDQGLTEGLELLECKSTSGIKKWATTPPIEYLCQQYAQLLVTGLDTNIICGCSTNFDQGTGKEFILNGFIYKLTRSDRLDSLIKGEIKRYWQEGDNYKVNKVISTTVRLSLISQIERLYP